VKCKRANGLAPREIAVRAGPFIADEALIRGAAIAFYTATSLAPALLIVIAIAGLIFGHDAAQNAISHQLSGLMGEQTANCYEQRSRAPRRNQNTEPQLPSMRFAVAGVYAGACSCRGGLTRTRYAKSLGAIWFQVRTAHPLEFFILGQVSRDFIYLLFSPLMKACPWPLQPS